MQSDPVVSSSARNLKTRSASRSGLVLANILCLFAVEDATLVQAACNPNGTANEVISCIDDANLAAKKQLTQFYSQYLGSLDNKCQAEFSGGGSGGHQDRAICLQNKLKQEAARIGMPSKR